ncbi:MAG: YkgJ family cysteine cluster protein [Polyangiaceae bacterium]
MSSTPLPTTTEDCRHCAACCRGAADGRILVSAEDLVRWRRAGQARLEATLMPGHFSMQGLPALEDGSCTHLGTSEHALDCSIYELRPESCRALEPGSQQCLDYRRTAGIGT